MTSDRCPADYLRRQELEALQLERLKAVCQRVYQRVPRYKAAFDAAGVTLGDIRSLDDLRRLPFISKTDLRDHYPFGLFATPLEDVVRIHASSGTTGKPTIVGYTAADIDVWSEVMKRTFLCVGLTEKDIVQNAYGYGLFTGGLGAHYGIEALGALCIPMSGGNTDRQIMMLADLGATAICCTPSYFLFLVERAQELGVDFRTLPLKKGVFGAEPWTAEMRRRIEARADIEAFDIYGLSEIIGPGVSIECDAHEGLHVFEDHFLPEIVDPETGENLPPGETGELVFTTLTKQATPMLRYRTGDITSLSYGTCTCGRTLVRMARVTGRTDDMLIIRGVNVFPSQIESVLLEVEGVLPQYELLVSRVGPLDDLEVRVEVSPATFSDEVRSLEEMQRRIQERLESVLGLRARVRLLEPKSIERSTGKARRVVGMRGGSGA